MYGQKLRKTSRLNLEHQPSSKLAISLLFRAFPNSLPRDHGPTVSVTVLDMLNQVQNSTRSIGVAKALIKSYILPVRGEEVEVAETSTLARVREDTMGQFIG